jgi:hypothetical protein
MKSTNSISLSIVVFSCLFAFTSKAQTITLTPSDFNGYNISCTGFSDGSINMTITGGTPPYTIRWSNDMITEDINNLQAGYYAVEVDDSDPFTDMVYGDITLTEPEPLNIIELVPFVYQNGYNVSTFGACNGSVAVNLTGGIPPYSYLWQPGNQNTTHPTNLCGNENQITITDHNGCIITSGIGLREPERDDWTMSGNYNSNPANQFIGTLDNKDLVFKTNNLERIKLKASGLVDCISDLNLQNGLFLKNSIGLAFQAQAGLYPKILSFGKEVSLAPYSIGCTLPSLNTPTNYQFSGTIQVYGTPAGGSNLNILELGFDGINSVIEATGNSPDPIGNRLLINYYCGRDVFVGNSLSGNLTANKDFFVNGNTLLGTETNAFPEKKFVVKGNVRLLDDIGFDTFDFILSDSEKPLSRGISIGNHPSGKFNFWIDSDQVLPSFDFKLSNNNALLMTLTDWGHLGIGTNNPLEFQDGAPSNNHSHRILHMKGENPTIRLENTSANTSDFVLTSGNGMGRLISDKGLVVFLQASGVNTPDNYFTIIKNHTNFSAPIPDSDVLFKVNNDGYIGAHGVKVTAGTFPDYVFDDNYDLMDLNELREYIETYNRLPGIPSANEVMKEGIDVGSLLVKQMEKIEELTLYLIQISNENIKIKQELNILKNKTNK